MVETLQERALLDKNCFTTEFLQICKEEDLPIIIIAREWKGKFVSLVHKATITVSKARQKQYKDENYRLISMARM